MKTSCRFGWLVSLLTVCLLTWCLTGCNRGRKAQEVGYVSAPQVALRDRVAAVYNKTGMVKNGDRVRVLDRDRRFVRVRMEGGAEGWMEQRYLVSQQVYDGFQKLTQQVKADPVQAGGTTRNDTNIHIEPGRETEHLYQLNQGAKIFLLKRATVEKILPGTAPQPAAKINNPSSKAVTPIMEDWWLIRDPEGHVGWVLARMIDLDVPLEIAQYAEGQRTVAFFVLNEVADGDKKVAQYLVLLTESRDGMPFDYNQARVYTWNLKRHRYETAYRERNLSGVLPAMVTQENFDKEGTLPVFVLRVTGEDGHVTERKYKFSSPMVRRVLAPGEESHKAAGRQKGH